MREQSLAELAETAGYMVFKIGAAGTLLGVLVGVTLASGESGWQSIEVWYSYSLAVTIAGALIGSLAGICQSHIRISAASRTERPVRTQQAYENTTSPLPAGTDRPAISAFRGVPRTIRIASR